MKFKYVILFSVVLYTLCIRCSVAGGVNPVLIKTGGLIGEISFSPDNQYLALSGSYQPLDSGGTQLSGYPIGETKVFSVPSWREIDIKNYSDALGKIVGAEPIAWSPNSLNLFISIDNNKDNDGVAIVDIKGCDVRTVWRTPRPYQITALLPITNEVIAMLQSGLHYFDVKNGRKSREFAPVKPIDCGDNILARVDDDVVYELHGNVVRRNIKSGKTIESKCIPPLGAITLAVSRNQKEIAVTYIDKARSSNGFNSRYVQLLKASDLSPIGDAIFVDDKFAVDRLLFDHDDQSLILLLDLPFTDPVTKEEKFDTLIERLDLKSQQLTRLMRPVRALPRDLAESNDGHYLACSTSDGIYILDFQSK